MDFYSDNLNIWNLFFKKMIKYVFLIGFFFGLIKVLLFLVGIVRVMRVSMMEFTVGHIHVEECATFAQRLGDIEPFIIQIETVIANFIVEFSATFTHEELHNAIAGSSHFPELFIPSQHIL